MEEFKQCNKNELLNIEGKRLIENFKNDNILEDPSLLVRFFVLSFAVCIILILLNVNGTDLSLFLKDLKSHRFYYWFGFPCPLAPLLYLQKPAYRIQTVSELQDLPCYLENVADHEKNFFVLNATDSRPKFLNLKHFKEIFVGDMSVEKVYFCYSDPSHKVEPSWLLRLYAIFIHYKL